MSYGRPGADFAGVAFATFFNMAFKLNGDSSVRAQLRKLIRKEFKKAIGELQNGVLDEVAIHEARKSVKKIRAVLRLLRDHLGPDFDRENQRLRDAAHRLSFLRDADVTRETLQALHGRYPTVMTAGVVKDVETGLNARTRRTKAHADRQAVIATTRLQQALDSAPEEIRRVGKFPAVRSGVTTGYRRARRAMASLDAGVDAAGLHAWRRRVKDHWYHMRLFEPLHSAVRGRVRRLERLETWLGEDHDLAILQGIILETPDRFGKARSTALVLGCIAKYQLAVRERALRLGHRLFARKPKDFAQAVTGWWATGSS